jgi:hypothetical protein
MPPIHEIIFALLGMIAILTAVTVGLVAWAVSAAHDQMRRDRRRRARERERVYR